jgi:NAD(P)-dependent dehydrogenase (short-subunit alcohol dehydrogenase family)
MKDFAGNIAVITGAGSGFGREFARLAASLGMNLALADIQADALDAITQELRGKNTEVLALRTDVSREADMSEFADAVFAKFGNVHLLFNNAGVADGGFIWESSLRDWEWVLGVNLWSVIYGVKFFVPRMLAQQTPGHIINTASVAGLVTPQMLGVYNVSKHGVVALSETLYHDLRVANSDIGVTVLCPAFVDTGINDSARNRPADLQDGAAETESQRQARAQTAKASSAGRLSAAQVAEKTFDCIRENQFYCITHPRILDAVALRLDDIARQRNPSDPFAHKPEAAFNAR